MVWRQFGEEAGLRTAKSAQETVLKGTRTNVSTKLSRHNSDPFYIARSVPSA